MRKIKPKKSIIISCDTIPNLKGGFYPPIENKAKLVSTNKSSVVVYRGVDISYDKPVDKQHDPYYYVSRGGDMFKEHTMISNISFLLTAIAGHEGLYKGTSIDDLIKKYFFWYEGKEILDILYKDLEVAIADAKHQMEVNPYDALRTSYCAPIYITLGSDYTLNPLLDFIRDNEYKVKRGDISCVQSDLNAESRYYEAYVLSNTIKERKSFPFDGAGLVYSLHTITLIDQCAIDLKMESPVAKMLNIGTVLVSETISYYSNPTQHYVNNKLTIDFVRLRITTLFNMMSDKYEDYDALGLSDDDLKYDLLMELENQYALHYGIVVHKYNKRKSNQYKYKSIKELIRVCGPLHEEFMKKKENPYIITK